MKAFVGHSFEQKDSQIVAKIIDFLKSAKVECQTGEEAQNRSVAEKVKTKISTNDIFIGIFTCDKEIVGDVGEGSPKNEKAYTTSNWVIQESGFAIGCDRELIFLVEKGVYKFPELQSDLEVIYFDRKSLEDTFLKINQMVGSIIKRKSESDGWGTILDD
jgi:hypothetical protein